MVLIMISFWYDVVLLATFAFVLFYIWTQRKYTYWKNKGIEGPEPKFLVGNLSGLVTGKYSLGDIFENIYNRTRHLPHAGAYMMLRPCWVVNDLELIKKVMIKDFAHFVDHGYDFNYKIEPLAENLFNIRGEKWRNLRMKLSPAFTSSRMKQMFGILESCSKVMLEFMDREEIVDVKELLCKFTTDVIGSCAFGIDCNSFKDPDAEFRKCGKMLTNLPTHKALLQFFFFFFSPELLKSLPITILPKELTDFFIKTISDTVAYREKNNIVKNDILQLLIQLMKQGEISDDDVDQNPEESQRNKDDGSRLTIVQLAAQAFVFFFGGFETSSTSTSFALLELAKNPDVKKKLVEEIDSVMEKNGGKHTYDSLLEMNYMTMVIEETLRKYPVVPILFRICTKDYTIPNTNVTLEKDTSVMIPIYAIQRDERYFPDPEKFDPERFTRVNKESRNHFSYLPFGEGPRICIGSRFGLMQIRLGLASLLSQYDVSICDKSPIPMVYDKKSLVLNVEGPVYLKMTKRIK